VTQARTIKLTVNGVVREGRAEEQPKLVAGFIKATPKSLRLIRQDRETTIAGIMKFSD
jgi:ABC-type nitrate/sulfonate/bicarbonate transport system substrate-binding protein